MKKKKTGKKIYRSHFGVDGDVDDKTVSFVECFVKWSLLNCSSDAISHRDCNLFPADIDEPLTDISLEEGPFPLSGLALKGRRIILVPHETK